MSSARDTDPRRDAERDRAEPAAPLERRRAPRDVLVRCPLCGANDYRVVLEPRSDETFDPHEHYASTSKAYGRHGRIVRCRSCTLVYQNPRPHNRAVQEAYGEVRDTLYLEEEQGRLETFAASLDLVRSHRPSGELLDVGCHVGTFLVLAERAGYRVTGVEPSKWAVEVARERVHGRLLRSTIEDAPLAEGAFDVVTMWDVIESLADPAFDVRAIYEALKPGGVFAVSAVDVDALAARLAGRRWPWWMHSKLVYFSRQTLCELLRREGFEIADVRAQTRRVRLSYVASRVARYAPRTAAVAARGLRARGLGSRTVGLRPGDIFTVVARRPYDA